MTAAFLQSELTNLIADSKRKHVDVKAAAEKSLTELKSISVTSETQLAGDLIRKISFIDPFLLACKSGNTKLASNGAACLQRLVASTAVPHSRLSDLLQAFEEAVPLALEVQLKILQTLPSLLQLYATDLHGEVLSRTLSVSADLSSNKLPMVSGTASATFQQLLTAVFARAIAKSADRPNSDQDSELVQEKQDALAIFVDLCALLSGTQSNFVRLERSPPALVLEAVESVLGAYGNFLLSDQNSRKACAGSLVPGLQTLIENSASYSVVARAIRITFILATQHLALVKKSLSDLLMVVLRIVDRGGSHKWKRVLVLEFCRGICSDFEALRRSFAAYDMADGGINFISDLTASLVRIASEDPSLIGLGRQSTIPSTASTESSGEVTRATDLPAAVGSVSQAEVSTVGLSAQRSTIQIPCLDQYDRSAPPEIPETYIFTLVLSCISAFSDGLSKLIMPLSVPNRRANTLNNDQPNDDVESQPQRRGSIRNAQETPKYQQLLNPLTRKDTNKYSSVEECAKMIESCWPAVLAICSTFLNSALDSYFYHMLIRTVQKLTQVSGVLELNTPRDALLTLLAKVSVPVNVSGLMNTLYGGQPAYQADYEQRDAEDSNIQTLGANTPRHSIDLTSQTLNVRNLLCLRALLNLGIALGPTLSTSAWTILWQSVEQVEALMSVNPANKAAQSTPITVTSDGVSQTTLASETSAVEIARKRMVESTTAYPDAAFQVVCNSLFGMIEDVIPAPIQQNETVSGANGALRPKGSQHQSSRSVSGSWAKATTLEIEVQFVLKSIGRLASVNLHRFRQADSSAVSWNLIVAMLSLLQSNQKLLTHLRLQCANIIDAIVVESCNISGSDESEDHETNDAEETGLIIPTYSIPALGRQISNVRYHASGLEKTSEVESQTVLLVLQALHNVISSSGDDLRTGWNQIFEIIRLVTSHHVLRLDFATFELTSSQAETIAKIYSAAFRVTHLISTEFLPNLDQDTLAELLALFAIFGSQKIDLNMSLTTTALYWNICGLVRENLDLLPPFMEIPDLTNSENATTKGWRKLNLWHAAILGLQNHCKDSRSDTRDAAVRMLTKIIETSLPKMSSQTLNSYHSLVSLPLINHFSKQELEIDSSWKNSALKVLQDIVEAVQSNSALVMEHDSFHDFWLQFITSSSNLLRIRDTDLITAAFNALSDLVSSLYHCTKSANFSTDKPLLEACWNLWLSYDPTNRVLEGQNQLAYTSYARFLVVMGEWNLGYLSEFEQSSKRISEAMDRMVSGAVHDNYTVDINKASVEQEQALLILDMLKQLLVNNRRTHILHLLSLASKIVSRTMSISSADLSIKSAKGIRQPTGIAFATACIGKLRDSLQVRPISEMSFADYPFHNVLEVCAMLTKTKYSGLPTNSKLPLWHQATLLATECTAVIRTLCDHGSEVSDIEAVSSAINNVLSAILEVPHLDSRPPGAKPPEEMVLADERFDIVQLKSFHSAAHQIFLSVTQNISPSSQKQYILTLFNQSLIAEPWYNDLSSNLIESPLQNFTKIRPGSTRAPKLSTRQEIHTSALDCLFSLVSAHPPTNPPDQNPAPATTLSTLAAPYILLRLSHTLKTFIADQPLRYLQHPHLTLQYELHVVFRAFLNLRVSDQSFRACVTELNLDATTVVNDGKTHLRIMTGLVMRFEKLWRGLPRLRKGLAWQDYEGGMGVEECLREWRELLSQGTTVRFE